MSEQERAINNQGECNCAFVLDNMYEAERRVIYCINCAKPVSVEVAHAYLKEDEDGLS